ncbi:MAG: lysophospholipase [Acidimicrobiia bacterium]|nr:lysophospholipase [Acidimicrobiia bacterium]
MRPSAMGIAIGAVAAAAGALAGRKVIRFYRDLRFDTAEDERIVVETDDGWQLTLDRYAARGSAKPYPVVAGHGFAGSHLIWDLTPQTSLARFLADAGFDFYAVDLRGRGDSTPVGGSGADAQWSFDDIVQHDLPTAVAAACARSGSDEAFWVGLEMSGQALYAAAISETTGQLRGGITCGSPAITPPSAKVPGVTAPPRSRRDGRIPFRAGARAAGPLLALTRSRQLESSFRPANTDPIVPARYLYNGVPDESTVLADQFADWVAHGTMHSLDATTVWSDRLDEVTLPLLVMAGARDLQRPADAVRATFEQLGSADKTYIEAGTAAGFSVDHGHDDLVAGRASRAEIFPRISAWLDDHS